MRIRGINFSEKYTTGSAADRKQRAETLRAKFYSDIINAYHPKSRDLSAESGKLPLRTIEKLLKSALPEFINFYFAEKNPEKTYDGCVNTKFDRSKISHYRVELPSRNKKLPIEKLPTLMHEVTHLLDFALNPQYRAVTESLKKMGLLEEVYKLYKDAYYTNKTTSGSTVRHKTKKQLRGFSAEEKLAALRYIKLQMLTEINGFSAAKTCAVELNKITSTRIPPDLQYYFGKKIELVDKMRSRIITKERFKQKLNCRLHKIG